MLINRTAVRMFLVFSGTLIFRTGSALGADLLETDQDWSIIRKEAGITIMWNKVPHKEVPVFQGQTQVPYSMWEVLATLHDIEKMPDWSHRCVAAKTIKKNSEKSYVVYHRTDAPWPFLDRDVVLEVIVDVAKSRKEVIVRFQDITHEDYPVSEKLVRMPSLSGHYRVVKLGEYKSLVEYRVDADPGGGLPNWVKRMIGDDLPYFTLKMLRERIAITSTQEKYQNIALMLSQLD